MYLLEEDLEVHPFLGESLKYASRVWRDPLQKNSSTPTVSINESFKDGLDTERPAKSVLYLQGFGGGASICRTIRGGEEHLPRGSLCI